ncbi:Endospore coat-associated protein YheD [Sporotomaculum syntrophicum]|uniref:Endospore coat-associated protein YheD n=1 Tax=Sporotomaculum syntrophicum TaxID=182264 RepID=A0A9D2WLU4_9FIRM|nr:YheC/YheD family protein [Sporotomaculum syntrophicum]KAF1083822.1 Endospore coat-associated protein YheD [Sporotomaculum syntrophicum]
MKVSKGRWSQYLILNSDPNITQYLLEVNLLTKQSLINYLNKYNNIEILPCYGHDSILIYSLGDDKYKVDGYKNSVIIKGIEHVYNYLQEKLLKPKKRYIIKPNLTIQAQHITVQQDPISSEWKTSSNNYNEIAGRISYKLEKIFTDCTTIVIKIIHDKKGKPWITDVTIHPLFSKWSQYQIFKASKKESYLIPVTEILTYESLFNLLEKFKQVIIKPCFSQWGLGIAQITIKENNAYEIHTERTKHELVGQDCVFEFLQTNFLLKNRYLIQQKIPLALIDGSIFDVRILIQWDSKNNEWVITGKLAKIAHDGYLITNMAKELLPLDIALELASIKNIENKISQVSKDMAKQLKENFKDIKIIGFDLGIDLHGNIWFIEANFKPDIYMFYMYDKTMHEQIMKALIAYK